MAGANGICTCVLFSGLRRPQLFCAKSQRYTVRQVLKKPFSFVVVVVPCTVGKRAAAGSRIPKKKHKYKSKSPVVPGRIPVCPGRNAHAVCGAHDFPYDPRGFNVKWPVTRVDGWSLLYRNAPAICRGLPGDLPGSAGICTCVSFSVFVPRPTVYGIRNV